MATEIVSKTEEKVCRTNGQSGFNMMTAPSEPRQVLVSENLSSGEAVRIIGGQKFVCTSAGNVTLTYGGGYGCPLK